MDGPVTDTLAAAGSTVGALDRLLALRDGRILARSERGDLVIGTVRPSSPTSGDDGDGHRAGRRGSLRTLVRWRAC